MAKKQLRIPWMVTMIPLNGSPETWWFRSKSAALAQVRRISGTLTGGDQVILKRTR